MSTTSSFDPRVDRAISWGLNLACCVALSVGAWMFNDLRDGIRGLNDSIIELKLQVASSAHLQSTVAELKTKFEAHEQLEGHPVGMSRLRGLEEVVREFKKEK